jgi:hypothetical protein
MGNKRSDLANQRIKCKIKIIYEIFAGKPAQDIKAGYQR